MSSHTPGPWVYYVDMPSVEPGWHIVTTANKMRVLANVHIEPGNAVDEANARLIAAAPDLYRVCEALVSCEAKRLVMSDIVDAARAAISAAEGSRP